MTELEGIVGFYNIFKFTSFVNDKIPQEDRHGSIGIPERMYLDFRLLCALKRNDSNEASVYRDLIKNYDEMCTRELDEALEYLKTKRR